MPTDPVSPVPLNEPPTTALPTRIRMFDLVAPQDFPIALTAAGIEADPPAELAATEATVASRLAWGVVTSLVVPTIPAMRKTMAWYLDLERIIGRLIGHLTRQPSPIPAEHLASAQALSDYLHDNEDLLLGNLVSHIGREGGDEAGRAVVADAILRLHHVADGCASVVSALDLHITSEVRARRSPEMRSRQRELGFAFLSSYQTMTARDLKISRTSDGPEAGRLGGPLIRFMRAMFEQARARLHASPEIGHLADDGAWRPSAETIRSWIKAYKQRWPSPTERPQAGRSTTVLVERRD